MVTFPDESGLVMNDFFDHGLLHIFQKVNVSMSFGYCLSMIMFLIHESGN